MDESRFDNLARTLATSRRGILKHALAGLLTAAASQLEAAAAAMQGCTALGKTCAADGECCSGSCDPGTGRCACGAGSSECTGACLPLDQYQTDIENCGACGTTCKKAPECHMPACAGGACTSVPDPSLVGSPCGKGGEVCAADGSCACPSNLPVACPKGCVDTASDLNNCGACGNRCPDPAHGSATCAGGACGFACDAGYAACGDGCCADGRECCNGDCCGPNECCGTGGCVACRCDIGIASYDQGEINPDNACQYCDPTRNTGDWTLASNGSYCGEGRVCCNGDCCGPTECCDGLQCSEAACPDQCEIQGQPVEAGDRNDANDCQVCNPDENRFGWTLVDDNVACGGVSGRVCCNGECCSPTECCNPAGFCEECGPHCRIDGADVDAGTAKPGEPCQVCKPDDDFDSWSTAPDDTGCGVDRVCCNGTCCPQGQCCVNGACQNCGCQIGEATIETGTINRDNVCQVCDPGRSRTSWSPVLEKAACGANDDQACCGGECCETGECCLLDACGECLCLIGEDTIAAGIHHPDNPCLVCDPERDAFDWSTTLPEGTCGPNDDQECCYGTCCEPGLCCTLGVCGMCGCLIEGVEVAEFVTNEANPCEWCNPVLDQFTWSPRSDEPCGANGDQVCCTGVCCEQGHRCGLNGACEPHPCEIDGTTVLAGTPNPGNVCEVCDPARSRIDWSPAAPGTTCGDQGDQVCCEGACCLTGECCHTLDGACGPLPCQCTIDGVVFDEGAPNPDNSCEVCHPSRSATSWSQASNHAKCGPALNQVCCNGRCCPDGDCCRPDIPALACSIEWCGTVDPCDYEDPCGCTIDSVFYPHETINPANECQWCNAYFSTTSWYSRGNFTSCGPNGDQYCCSDTCCELGACCNDADVCDSESPYCKGCVIASRFYRHLAANPDNPCQQCNADLSETSWSITPNNRSCGQMIDPDGIYWGDLYCCEGACCTEWFSCCRGDGTCGQGPCTG